eukprot:4637982-Pyramimonas_sp.AAC.1
MTDEELDNLRQLAFARGEDSARRTRRRLRGAWREGLARRARCAQQPGNALTPRSGTVEPPQ